MSIELRCKTEEVRAAIQFLRPALPSSRKELGRVMLEFSFKPNEVELSVIGASYHFKIENRVFAKVLMRFVPFERLVKTWNSPEFVIAIDKGAISYASTTIESAAIKVLHPENQLRIELPMNYTDIDLLRIERQYSYEELGRMNLLSNIDKAKDRAHKSIDDAMSYLAPYGIRREDVENLLRSSIERKS